MGDMVLVDRNAFLSTYNCKALGERSFEKFSHWFPVKANPVLAEVVANLMTDGHLATKKIGNRIKLDYIGFFSDETEELDEYRAKIKKLFKIDSNHRPWGVRFNGRSTGVIICNSALERVLILCGTPVGDKTVTEFGVPEWIKKSENKTKACFLRGLFDCDGSISYDSYSKGWEIRFFSFKTAELNENLKHYLREIQEMLLNFEVKSFISINRSRVREKDGKLVIGYSIVIKRKESIRNFKQIGFSVKHKKERLQKALMWAG